MLFDDVASLTVPYWHKDRKAQTVFAQIWEHLKVIHEVGGYQIYDPQIGRIVNLGSDLDEMTKRYYEVVRQIIG
jgi:hypothetical protein